MDLNGKSDQKEQKEKRQAGRACNNEAQFSVRHDFDETVSGSDSWAAPRRTMATAFSYRDAKGFAANSGFSPRPGAPRHDAVSRNGTQRKIGSALRDPKIGSDLDRILPNGAACISPDDGPAWASRPRRWRRSGSCKKPTVMLRLCEPKPRVDEGASRLVLLVMRGGVHGTGILT